MPSAHRVDYKKLTRALREFQAPPCVYKVALYVAEFGADGTPRISHSRLGAALATAKNTAAKAIALAVDGGWIEATAEKNSWRFRVSDRWLKPAQKVSRSGDASLVVAGQNGSTNGLMIGSISEPLSDGGSTGHEIGSNNGSTNGSISEPIAVVTRTRTRSSRKPKELNTPRSKKSRDLFELSAAALAFGEKIDGLTTERREAFEYLCKMCRVDWRMLDAKKLDELGASVGALLRADPPMSPLTLRVAQAAYRARDWRDPNTRRRIPLGVTLLCRHWAALTAEPEPEDADTEEQRNGQPKTFRNHRDDNNASNEDAIKARIRERLGVDAGRGGGGAPGGVLAGDSPKSLPSGPAGPPDARRDRKDGGSLARDPRADPGAPAERLLPARDADPRAIRTA